MKNVVRLSCGMCFCVVLGLFPPPRPLPSELVALRRVARQWVVVGAFVCKNNHFYPHLLRRLPVFLRCSSIFFASGAVLRACGRLSPVAWAVGRPAAPGARGGVTTDRGRLGIVPRRPRVNVSMFEKFERIETSQFLFFVLTKHDYYMRKHRNVLFVRPVPFARRCSLSGFL